jgi:hypothetical protein
MTSGAPTMTPIDSAGALDIEPPNRIVRATTASWWRKTIVMNELFRSPDSPPPGETSKRIGRVADEFSARHRIDLHEAIRDHTELRKKLCYAISKKQSLDVASISKNTCCAFGKWLNDDASQAYRSLDGYRACLDSHTAFHLEATKVAQAINEKIYSEAEQMLAVGTNYSEASIALGLAITRMMRAANLCKPRRQDFPLTVRRASGKSQSTSR